MTNAFIEIVNYYSDSENDIQEFFDKNLEISKKIGKLPIQRDLTYDLVVCFTLNPIKDSLWKVYKNLKPNAKVGFLSRKLMSMARELNISQTHIRRFVSVKDSWHYSKKYDTIHKDKEKVTEAVNDLIKNTKLEKTQRILRSEIRHNSSHIEMFHETNFFIKLITEETLKRNARKDGSYK
jgi:hypothetical protein